MEGMAQVQARLNLAVAAMAGPAAEKTVDRVAEDTAAGMRAAAPVLSGELRGSIHVVKDGHGSREIVADSEHAAYNEFGTVHMDEQPFFRPPLHQAEEALPRTARSVYRSTVPYLD